MGVAITIIFFFIYRSQNNRMRIALGLVISIMLPFVNGVAKGWQGLREINVVENVKTGPQMITNLMVFAANTISLSLSTVQGKKKNHFFPF